MGCAKRYCEICIFGDIHTFSDLRLRQRAGLHALMALRSGARHVTAVERWLYLSLAAKQSLVANGGGLVKTFLNQQRLQSLLCV